MPNIAQRLKEIRIEKRMTQAELGEKLGIKRQAIANIEAEKNNPSIEFISKLIENLNVNANWLIAGIGEPFNVPAFEEVEDEFTAKVRKLIQEELAKKNIK